MNINSDLVVKNKTLEEIENVVTDLETDEYSTNETKTNKVWINGKPIYRRVFAGTMQSNQSQIELGITTNLNIETVVNMYAFALSNDKSGNPFYYWTTDDMFRCRIATGGNIYLMSGTKPLKPFAYNLVIEYTKTV